MLMTCFTSDNPRECALVLCLLLFSAALCPLAAQPLPYPDTPRGTVVDDYHSTHVPDPYRWLETLGSDETETWIAAQNAVTEPYIEDLHARPYFAERLRTLRESVPPGVPQKQGAYWVTRTRRPDGPPLFVVQDALGTPPPHTDRSGRARS